MSTEPRRQHHRRRAIAWRLSDERGQAMVEFALVVPLLFLIVIGIVDFGRALNYWIDETHLANQAARWAVVNKSPSGGDGSQIVSDLTSQSIPGKMRNGLTITFSCPGGNVVGQPITATVGSNFNWTGILGFLPPLTTSTFNASATMRLEQESAACPS